MSQSKHSSQDEIEAGIRKRKRAPTTSKGADWYAAEYPENFISRPSTRADGQPVKVLVCRFCEIAIGPRSDRIKEHLASKRHQNNKGEAVGEGQVQGQGALGEGGRGHDNASAPASLPPPSVTPPPKLMKMTNPGKPLGGQQQQQAQGEGEGGLPLPKTMTPPLTKRFPGGGLGRGGPTAATNVGNSPRIFTSSPNQRPTTSTPKGPPPPASSQQELGFKVKWDNFDSNLVSMFSQQRELGHYVNVTIWCEGKSLQCHQAILAASSKYFDEMLRLDTSPHPIIILKDVRFWELEALVEYMYRGEVVVSNDQLGDLTRAAQSLQIKGLITLTQDDTDGLDQMNRSAEGGHDGGSRGRGRQSLHQVGRSSPSPGGTRSGPNSAKSDLHAAVSVGIAKSYGVGGPAIKASPSSGTSSPVSRAGGFRNFPGPVRFRKSGEGNLPSGRGPGGHKMNSNGGRKVKMESVEAGGGFQPVVDVKINVLEGQGYSNDDNFGQEQTQGESDVGLQDRGKDQEMEVDQEGDATASSSSSSRQRNDNRNPPRGNGNGRGRGRTGK